MSVATYELPEASLLQGEADPAVFAGLEYVCIAHNVKCPCAEGLRSHVEGANHKKKLAAEGITEDPEIVSNLTFLAGLEGPHREAKKNLAGQKAKEFLDKVKGYKEELKAMSPEEQKARKEEMKLKRAGERGTDAEDGSSKKKKKSGGGGGGDGKSFICVLCDEVLMNKEQVNAHWRSAAHQTKAATVGCDLCKAGAEGSTHLMTEHFESKKHLTRCAQLEAMGVNLNSLAKQAFKGSQKAPAQAQQQQQHQAGNMQQLMQTFQKMQGQQPKQGQMMQMMQQLQSWMGEPETQGQQPAKAKRGKKGREPAMAALAAPPAAARGAPPAAQGDRIDNYTCGCCKAQVTTLPELITHMQSAGHGKAAMPFAHGCDLCGVMGDGSLQSQQSIEAHYKGKAHLKRVDRLEGYGMDVTAYRIA